MEIHLPDEIADYEPQLRLFVDAMIYKLAQNSHKGKWEDVNVYEMMSRLAEEMEELHESFQKRSTTEALLEAADCANFAMIIALILIKGSDDPFAARTALDQGKHFLEWAANTDIDHCLPWPFKTRTGPNLEYGQISKGSANRIGGFKGKYGRRAHRVLCALAHGEPPTDKHVACHACGNPICVNPKHLYWGTAHDNAADKIKHGNQTSGTKHPDSKFTWAQIEVIRNRYQRGETVNSLANEFGVSYGPMKNIVTGVSYRHNWEDTSE
jgi:NTP pyrophosphatase (non-canonical NTP hydrolase)